MSLPESCTCQTFFSCSSGSPRIIKYRSSWKNRTKLQPWEPSCFFSHLDLIASGCFHSQRTRAKLSTRGYSSDRLFTGLQGDNCSVSWCHFTLRERSQLNLFVFVKKHLWHCCLFMYQFWQVWLNKNSALKTPGQKDRDVDNRVKFDLYVYPSNIFSPLIIKSSLWLFHVCPTHHHVSHQSSSNSRQENIWLNLSIDALIWGTIIKWMASLTSSGDWTVQIHASQGSFEQQRCLGGCRVRSSRESWVLQVMTLLMSSPFTINGFEKAAVGRRHFISCPYPLLSLFCQGSLHLIQKHNAALSNLCHYQMT